MTEKSLVSVRLVKFCSHCRYPSESVRIVRTRGVVAVKVPDVSEKRGGCGAHTLNYTFGYLLGSVGIEVSVVGEFGGLSLECTGGIVNECFLGVLGA